MSINRYIQPGDNPDLTKERKTCTFDTNELTCEIYGKEYAEKRRRVIKMIDETPSLHNPKPIEFMAREEKIENAARKTKAYIENAERIGDPSDDRLTHHFIHEVFGCDGIPFGLHMSMFMPALKAQAHDELLQQIMPRAKRFEIIGTYAQTEMGHGTNLRALQTTSTYDKTKQEFVLHTPTTQAMKWWPGNLGKMANYAVVAAQLYIEGKRFGTHNFLVQLRDEKTHQPLKGITIGDIGPKMAYDTTDNGFLRFDHYRIPRNNMLMKHSKATITAIAFNIIIQVAPDGTYTPPMHAKLGYSAMVHVRAHMTFDQGYFLAVAATVATRYSAVRRQGTIHKDASEVQILDYQTQQHRLFPQIARAYAFIFAGTEVKAVYEQSMRDIANGNTDILPDLHAITSGLKSVVTYEVGLGIEQCRMACGGHGYSAASGLPSLFGAQIGGATYEGENMVMLQQLARYLVKAVDKAAAGKPLSLTVAYIGKKGEPRKSVIGSSGGCEIEHLLAAVEHASRRLSTEAATMYAKLIAGGAARIHTRLYIMRAFERKVAATINAGARAVLADVLSLHLHYECVDMAHHLLEDGYCTGEQIKYMKKRLYEDLLKIRPNAVSLVDSFDQSDRDLNSVLGRRDGNVYEALYQWAKGSELNYTDVLPAVTKYIKPLQHAQSKL